MVARRAIVCGLVALVAAAGCASGTRDVALDPAPDAATQASPGFGAAPGFSRDPEPRCSGGYYSRAAGMCVSAGP